MAKDLIRTRHQITKFYGLKSQLQGISLRIQVSRLACALNYAVRADRNCGLQFVESDYTGPVQICHSQKLLKQFLYDKWFFLHGKSIFVVVTLGNVFLHVVFLFLEWYRH
jgi:hypothetical protein